MKKVKTIFMGTPEFAIPALKTLLKLSDVVCVVTKPDALVGRKKVLTPSPIKKLAIKENIPVLTPVKLKEEYQSILDYEPELIVTCAYGKIVPKVILDYPKYGCINIHASILPKYRGSAPMQWAIANGEKETGITLMYMDEKMDTGDIIDIEKISILDDDDLGSIHDKLSLLGSSILEKNFSNIINNNISRVKQDDTKATLAPMITREMELLNFNDYGKNIINKIRAFSPYPLTRTMINNEEVKIVKAKFIRKENTNIGKLIITKNDLGIECLDGIIYLEIIKPVGKKEMPIKSFLNGLK